MRSPRSKASRPGREPARRSATPRGAASSTRRPPALPRPAGTDKYTSKYTDLPSSPLFPFGHGLSYTSFEYKELKLSAPTITPGGTLKVSATVTNTGAREGAEVAQLYVHDGVGTVTRPVRALAGF